MPVNDYQKGKKICENCVAVYYEATKGSGKYTLQHVTGLGAEHIQRCRENTKKLRRHSQERVNFVNLDFDGFDGTPYLVWNTSEVVSVRECLQIGTMELENVLIMMKNLVSLLCAAHQLSVYHGGLSLENVFVRSGGRKVKISEFSLIPENKSSAAVDCHDAALVAYAAATGKKFTPDSKEQAEREARALLAPMPAVSNDFLCIIRKALDNGFSDADDMLQELEGCQIRFRFAANDANAEKPKGKQQEASPPPQSGTAHGAGSQKGMNEEEVKIDLEEIAAFERYRQYPNYDKFKNKSCVEAEKPYVEYVTYILKQKKLSDEYDALLKEWKRASEMERKKVLKPKLDALRKAKIELENAEKRERFKPSDMIETVFKGRCYPLVNFDDRESSEYHRLFGAQSHSRFNYDGKVLGAGGFATVLYRCNDDDDVQYVQKILSADLRKAVSWSQICKGTQSELEIYQMIERKRQDVSVRFYAHSSTPYSTIKRAVDLDSGESLKQIVLEMECGLSFTPFMFWFAQRSNFMEHFLVVIRDLFVLLRDLHDKVGLLHCDIKPENIVLVPQGDSCKPVFIDFNSAGKIDPRTGRAFYGRSVGGTLVYDSPEVKDWKASMEGPNAVPNPSIASFTPKSDVYSMALVVYELLNNCCRPTEVEKLKYHKMEYPARLSSVNDCIKARMVLSDWLSLKKMLMRCMSYDPEKRPSADEMVRFLNGIIRER